MEGLNMPGLSRSSGLSRSIVVPLLLLATACANGTGPQSSPAAANPDYVPISEQSQAGHTIDITMPPPGTGEAGDIERSLTFSLAVAAHADDGPARAGNRTLSSSGARPEEAYVIEGLQRPQEAVEIALAFIAKLYPAHRDLHAALLNGPGKIYVGQFDFSDGGTPHRLYFDLTSWAATVKAGA